MTPISAPDLLDEVSGLAPRAVALRDERPEVKRRTQTSADALFAPAAPDGLSEAERFAAAARVAALNESRALADHYRAKLAAAPGGAGLLAAVDGDGDTPAAPDTRQRAVLAHVDRLTRAPAEARAADLRTLEDVGLSSLAIVTLSQIVSFANYQVRVAFALALLEPSR